MTGDRPTLVRIDLGALTANFALAKRLAGDARVIAVVKADAYGHGAIPVAERLIQAGAESLAVVSVAEAVVLRDADLDAPILVLGGVHDAAEAEAVVTYRLTATVHHAGHVELLTKAAGAARAGGTTTPPAVPLPVQVEVDTGMRRMGIPGNDAAGLIEQCSEEPHLHLEGVFTHLAAADEEDTAITRRQLERFASLLAELDRRGIEPGTIHVANSAALLGASRLGTSLAAMTSVRPGLMLYGVRPASFLSVELQAVMTLQSRVVHVRQLAAGEGVGYGHSFRAPAATRVATLPVGYADGIPWSSGNHGFVIIAGRRLPIVGRISMDYVTVDVGAHPVEIGDEAILFGAGSGGCLPVEEVAAAAGTIPYELLVRVGARVPRVLVG